MKHQIEINVTGNPIETINNIQTELIKLGTKIMEYYSNSDHEDSDGCFTIYMSWGLMQAVIGQSLQDGDHFLLLKNEMSKLGLKMIMEQEKE